jgi:hypothetical protein
MWRMRRESAKARSSKRRRARLLLRIEESARALEIEIVTGSERMPGLSCMKMPAPAAPEYDPAGQAVQEEPPAGDPSKRRSQARMQRRADRWRVQMNA